MKLLEGLIRNPGKAIRYWIIIYFLVFIISLVIMKILEMKLIIPDDEPHSKAFFPNSTAFADSMAYRWIVGLPMWVLFSRDYFLKLKLRQEHEIKTEAINLTFLWITFTLIADLIVWALIPLILGYNPIDFLVDNWPWLLFRYAIIYISLELSKIPAMRIAMRKRF